MRSQQSVFSEENMGSRSKGWRIVLWLQDLGVQRRILTTDELVQDDEICACSEDI
jgi:hypothetical protein